MVLVSPVPSIGAPAPEAISGILAIHCDSPVAPPAWALYERKVIDALDQAGIEFYDKYVKEDGTTRWKERYEGGMNSSDDFYEAFRGLSLHTALGGSDELDRRHRKVWNGITRQFTRYGQIYREFDSNWDWMHHGEGYVSFYPLGMVEPNDALFRDRAIRFAAMYIGEDPEAPNYDPKLKQFRAVMTGSRGPKMEWTKRDWTPTNANLVYYHLPFLDIPGVTATTAWINDHPENDQFAKIVKGMSDRMAKGDVPLNLTVAPLIANAYLYTGDRRYVDWVKEYVGAWEERTARNNGITPDNVGLSGKVGEYTGHWWGGYYGWYWVGGGMHIVRAQLIAAKVAVMLTAGDTHWLELPRSQMAVMRKQGEVRDGRLMIPTRYDQRGWFNFGRESTYPYVELWYMSQEEQDWRQIERLADAEKQANGKITDPYLEWAYFLKGLNPGYPEREFSRDLTAITRKVGLIRDEHGDPETWVDNKLGNMTPMEMDSLVRFSIGGLPVHLQGDMLHSQVRYFDGELHRPGLPPDVAALVSRIEPNWIEVEIVNLNVAESRQLVVQGGAYGEHRILKVDYEKNSERPPGTDRSNRRRDQSAKVSTQTSQEVAGAAFTVNLEPGSGSTLRIHLQRYANQPSYAFPWDRQK